MPHEELRPGMAAPDPAAPRPAASAWAPLRVRVFRALWVAALVSNIGTWMQTVGAQWLLVHQAHAAILVPLVQTADMLPYVLFGLVAGVLASDGGRFYGSEIEYVAVPSTASAIYCVGRHDEDDGGLFPEIRRRTERLSTSLGMQVIGFAVGRLRTPGRLRLVTWSEIFAHEPLGAAMSATADAPAKLAGLLEEQRARPQVERQGSPPPSPPGRR